MVANIVNMSSAWSNVHEIQGWSVKASCFLHYCLGGWDHKYEIKSILTRSTFLTFKFPSLPLFLRPFRLWRTYLHIFANKSTLVQEVSSALQGKYQIYISLTDHLSYTRPSFMTVKFKEYMSVALSANVWPDCVIYHLYALMGLI